jgi:hypothetical protein
VATNRNFSRCCLTSPLDDIIRCECNQCTALLAAAGAGLVASDDVEVFAPLAYLDRIRVGTLAEVDLDAPIGGTHRAKVIVIDRVFDAASRTFGVRLELPNPGNQLPAGLNCRIRFGPTVGPAASK